MAVTIYKTEFELLEAIALYFINVAQQSIHKNGKFNVALSGGNSPIKLYQLLSSGEYKNKIEWDKVNFFFGDERYVPDNDEQRNSLMAQKTLFEPLHISPLKIFKVDTSLPPNDSAQKYSSTINRYFNPATVQFDLILLGLGDNSHTASLFPFTPVLNETSATIKAVFVKEQNNYRITMTAPMINQAKHIAFLVFGKEKAEAVRHVLKDERDIEKYPAQLIQPTDGEVLWFLDYGAASHLELPME